MTGNAAGLHEHTVELERAAGVPGLCVGWEPCPCEEALFLTLCFYFHELITL